MRKIDTFSLDKRGTFFIQFIKLDKHNTRIMEHRNDIHMAVITTFVIEVVCFMFLKI